MNPKYLPFDQRKPNTMYKDSLRRIIRRGKVHKHPFQTVGRRFVLTLPPMVFKLENGFPLITERSIKGFWRKPIAELLAFIHGVRTADELSRWGCNWWGEKWATPEKCAEFELLPGDLGIGSYGGALVYQAPQGVFRQYEWLLRQIRDYPDLITHKVTTWMPHYCLGNRNSKRKVVVAPCHGDVEVTLWNGKLSLRMDQRSADFPVGVPSNIIQYAALTVMIAHVTGNDPYMYIHAPHNAHVYEDQIEHVKVMINGPTLPFPSVYLTEEGLKITDLFDFRPHHFELRDYYPNPAIPEIPVTT